MSSAVRPHRSLLFMPGSNSRALEKAKTLSADGLAFDLEDAVSPDAKDSARKLVCAAVRNGGYGQRYVQIRVNGLGTPWGYDDIVAACTSGADAILLPKVESATTVQEVEAIMGAGGAPAGMAIWCMMETPRGMLHAEEIAGASPRVAGFVMGTSDLAKELHCAHTRERLPMITSLGLCMLAARAARIIILDGVYLDLGDEEGYEAACGQGRELGFDGKAIIHPKQVEAANRVFEPSLDELAWARKIILAHTEVETEGKGIVVVDGRVIENLHVAEAERIVAFADAVGRLNA
jgi:citrate lyase subunit beta / citryl-CoA lyase